MRRFSLCLTFIVMASGSVLAQNIIDSHQKAPRKATAAEEQVSQVGAFSDSPNFLESQTDFFYEDFSNGLDGATAYGAWTTEDTGTSDIWMMADANSPGGEFSNAATRLASESAENGWVIFDCDLYNTPVSAGFEDVTGFLILRS